MKKEYAILLRVANDPNIVQFFGACLCNPPMICMEYMEVKSAAASPFIGTEPLGLGVWIGTCHEST